LQSQLICNISFVELLMLIFGFLGGMCGENSCNVFVLHFMVLWIHISATLCRRAVLMLWHPFVFLLSSFAWWFPLHLLNRIFSIVAVDIRSLIIVGNGVDIWKRRCECYRHLTLSVLTTGSMFFMSILMAILASRYYPRGIDIKDDV
jgi:hypothetical protein